MPGMAAGLAPARGHDQDLRSGVERDNDKQGEDVQEGQRCDQHVEDQVLVSEAVTSCLHVSIVASIDASVRRWYDGRRHDDCQDPTTARHPPTRRDRADATRLRIVKAAYELFCERGYAGTMLSDIAAASGVAVQTVRFNFHTKGELLSRAYDFAVLGEGEPVPPQKQPW